MPSDTHRTRCRRRRRRARDGGAARDGPLRRPPARRSCSTRGPSHAGAPRTWTRASTRCRARRSSCSSTSACGSASRRRAPRRIGACASGKAPTPTRRARSTSTAPTSASPISATSSRTRCCAPCSPTRSPRRRRRSSSSAPRSSRSKREPREVVVALEGRRQRARHACCSRPTAATPPCGACSTCPSRAIATSRRAVVTHVTSAGDAPGHGVAAVPAGRPARVAAARRRPQLDRLVAADRRSRATARRERRRVPRRARRGERRRHRRAHGVLEARRLPAASVARAAVHGAARRVARRRRAYGAPARGSGHELRTS